MNFDNTNLKSSNSINSKKYNVVVIALGGSIIVSESIQTDFLKHFRSFLKKRIKEGTKFVIIAGGGKLARDYQKAASEVSGISQEDKDWLGIHSTRINAHLLRTIFAEDAYPVVLDSPDKKIKKRDFKNNALFFAAGHIPGWSTDYIAFRLAERFGVKEIVIATKIPYIYDKDVHTYKDAKPLENLSWEKYKKLTPHEEWQPGMKTPIDPVAAKFASENNLSCVLLQGTNLNNFGKYFEGKDYEGTRVGV